MQEAEADLENLRIMGLAIAELRIAFGGGVWTRREGWLLVVVGLSLCMSLRYVGRSAAEEEKVSKFERMWRADGWWWRKQDRGKVNSRRSRSGAGLVLLLLLLWHWTVSCFQPPKGKLNDTGASQFGCGLVKCIVRGTLERVSAMFIDSRYRGILHAP